MPVFGDDSWMNGYMGNCFIVKEDGTKVQFDGLATAQFVDNLEPDEDISPVIARIPQELACEIEIKQTHKQARQTRKFFKYLENYRKRYIRSYKRIHEKTRRSWIKGESNEYVYKQYRRSKYYYLAARELEKMLQVPQYHRARQT